MKVALSAGLGLASSAWDPVVARLPVGTQVVRVDRPGLGLSRAEPPRPLSLAREAGRVAEAVRVAGGAPAVLVGHSMGGFIVEACARLHPEVCAGLVLVDSSVETGAAPGGRLRRSAHEAASMVVERLSLGRVAAVLVAEDSSYPDLAVDLEGVRATHPLPDVPVTVLAAARSVWWPGAGPWLRAQRGLDARLAAELPTGRVRLDVIWGSGHRVMRDAPARVAEAIEATWARK